MLPQSKDDRIFSHFTNAEGLKGITGVDGDTLKVGQQIIVIELRFQQGKNAYLASEPGQVFVTELGIEATEGQLIKIGVFGDKQNFVIQFSEQEIFLLHNIRVKGQIPSRSIFTIPGGITLTGNFLVMRIQ